MQNLHLHRVFLNVVRVMILRNSNVAQVKKFLISKLESNHGNANILIIFAILVEEGIEYLRQIRQEMCEF